MDIVSDVLMFCPTTDFIFLAGVSKTWRSGWIGANLPKSSSVYSAAATQARTEWVLHDPSFEGAAGGMGGILRLSAEAGNLGGLQLAGRFYGVTWRSAAIGLQLTEIAAKEGHLEMLKWAREEGCPWDQNTCRCAAERGHLEVLRWAKEQGCPWDKSTCKFAARGGHLALLKWAREQGCPWDERTCSSAAKGGHLGLLQWARGQGCPWDEITCNSAAVSKNIEILSSARQQGCPWDWGICALAAVTRTSNLNMT